MDDALTTSAATSPAASTPEPLQSYVSILRAALPACIAVSAFAVSIGLVARANGFGFAAPTIVSATTYAGAAQVACVPLVKFLLLGL